MRPPALRGNRQDEAPQVSRHRVLFAWALLAPRSRPSFANILIQIDKPSQTMTVSVDGQLLYRWPVSTGATRLLDS